jgi:type IV pilus assembly protein PilA
VPSPTLRWPRHEDETGFTLIELMVVVLIIAILIAIAIPTFLGARQRSNDRAAQSNLRNALVAEKTYFTGAQSYTATASDLTAVENSLTYQNGPGAEAKSNEVYVAVSGSGDDTVELASRSAGGDCFWLRDAAGGATSYGTTSGACTTSPPSSYGSSW